MRGEDLCFSPQPASLSNSLLTFTRRGAPAVAPHFLFYREGLALTPFLANPLLGGGQTLLL